LIRGGYNAGMYKFGRNKEVVRFLIRNPRDGLESQLIIRQMLDTIFCTDTENFAGKIKHFLAKSKE